MTSTENIIPGQLVAAAHAAWGADLEAVLLRIAADATAADHDVVLDRLLSAEEQQRFASFRMAKRRREWLAGRLAAKLAAGKYLGVPADASLTVANLSDGRPYLLRNDSRLATPQLSISHSGAFAAALAAGRHCGIDVQEETDTLVKVMDRFCSEAEEELLRQALPELAPASRLNLLWSGKEAIRKAWSHDHVPGFLRLSCREIVSLEEAAQFRFLLEEVRQVLVHCCSFEGYALAICVPGGESHA